MKLSRRNLTLAGVVVLAIASWFAWDAWQTASAPGAASSYSEAKLREIKEKAKTVEEAKASGDEKKIQEAQKSLAETIGGRAGKMLSMAQSRNLTIEMYGKVIDQHGQPVAGAKVHMMVAGGGSFAPGSGPVAVTTDEAGMFRVQAKGQEIAIGSVKHPQLSAVRFSVGQDVAGTEHLDAVGRFGEKYSWRTYTTPDHPFVVNVWRVEKFEPVDSDSGYLEPVANGKPYVRAGLEVSCKRDPKEPNTHWRHQKGSWSITFRPIDGGIQETDDIYLNEAPESGYQKELTVSMQRGDPDYKVNIQPARRYYYTANSGKLYGAFSATFDPYMEDNTCSVKVSMKRNPNGSRNLAVVPKH